LTVIFIGFDIIFKKATKDYMVTEKFMITKKDILNYLKSQQIRYTDEFGIRFIGLFGSFARDEANDKSDIDILYEIEKNKKLSIFNYLKIINELENNFHKKVDLVRETTLKPQIKDYIYRDITYV
jgi:hypothetical protein